MRAEFYAKNRAAWRRWLSRNHATKSELFLVFFKKATGVECIRYDEAVEEALCFGWIDGVKQGLDEKRYSYRFTPRRPKSSWSPSNRKRVKEFLAHGRMMPAGFAAVDAAKRGGTWSIPDPATAPVSMPAELTAALARSAKAKRAFEALAPGYKRQWQRWVGEAKRPDTRERRAANAVELLREGNKVPRA